MHAKRKWHRTAAHAHNAVLSCFKTQEIGQSGHNALVFDDSTGQLGTRLHTSQGASQLNLGHIKRQRDSDRGPSHGHGAELRTDAYGAIRAGQGLLISADAHRNAGSAQMDANEAYAQKHTRSPAKRWTALGTSVPDTMMASAIESLG